MNSTYNRLILLNTVILVLCLIISIFGLYDFSHELYTKEYAWYIDLIPNTLLYIASTFIVISIIRKELNYKLLIPISIYCFLINLLLNFSSMSILKTIIDLIFVIILSKIKNKRANFLIHLISNLMLIIFVDTLLVFIKMNNTNILGLNFIGSFIISIDYYIFLITLYTSTHKGGGFDVIQILFSIYKNINKRIQKTEKVKPKLPDGIEENERYLFYAFMLAISLIQGLLLLVANYIINQDVIVILIIIFGFQIFKPLFPKEFHAKTLSLCTSITVLVFVGTTRLSLPLNVSVLINPLLALGLTFALYHLQNYLDILKDLNKTKEIKISRGMRKDELDNILEKYGHLLTHTQISILYKFYVDKHKLLKIAFEINYSIETVKKEKRKALDILLENKRTT